jgi:hypothetical protein
VAGFISDTELTTFVGDQLKTSVSQLPAYYTSTILPRANTAAWQEIQGRLLARGFSASQIAAWDRGAEFQADLGTFWAITHSGFYAGFDKETLKLMDRREELDKVQVFTGGVWVRPDDSQGNTNQGSPITTGNIFNWPDPYDPNIGEYTRW